MNLISDEEKSELLQSINVIAVIGLSPKESRPSHRVAKYLQGFSYKVIPVRPGITNVLGEKAYKSLSDIPFKVDLVNVFRASKYVQDILNECIKCKVPAIWLQEGVRDEKAAKEAQQLGITMIMDQCIYKEVVRLGINPMNKQ